MPSIAGHVPNRLAVVMRYIENYSSDTGAGGTNDQLWNLNSIFDPDRTGVGHQPMSHDEYAQLYNRYRVMKCFWNISIQKNDVDTESLYMVVCATNTTPTLTYETAGEQKGAKTIIVNNNGAGVQTIRGSTRINVLTGETLSEFRGDDENEATMSTSPTTTAILHLVTGSNTAQVTAFHVHVLLVYYVEVFDRIALGAS